MICDHDNTAKWTRVLITLGEGTLLLDRVGVIDYDSCCLQSLVNIQANNFQSVMCLGYSSLEEREGSIWSFKIPSWSY